MKEACSISRSPAKGASDPCPVTGVHVSTFSFAVCFFQGGRKGRNGAIWWLLVARNVMMHVDTWYHVLPGILLKLIRSAIYNVWLNFFWGMASSWEIAHIQAPYILSTQKKHMRILPPPFFDKLCYSTSKQLFQLQTKTDVYIASASLLSARVFWLMPIDTRSNFKRMGNVMKKSTSWEGFKIDTSAPNCHFCETNHIPFPKSKSIIRYPVEKHFFRLILSIWSYSDQISSNRMVCYVFLPWLFFFGRNGRNLSVHSFLTMSCLSPTKNRCSNIPLNGSHVNISSAIRLAVLTMSRDFPLKRHSETFKISFKKNSK